MNPISLNIEVKPDILVSLNKTADEFSNDIKLWAALSLYQFNKLSLAKAASLAGYHRYDFENILANLNIPISNLTIDDFKKDIEILDSL
jgi:predicted HTH domain antitoxin